MRPFRQISEDWWDIPPRTNMKQWMVYTSVILPGELNPTTLSINYNITCRYSHSKVPECDIKRIRAWINKYWIKNKPLNNNQFTPGFILHPLIWDFHFREKVFVTRVFDSQIIFCRPTVPGQDTGMSVKLAYIVAGNIGQIRCTLAGVSI